MPKEAHTSCCDSVCLELLLVLCTLSQPLRVHLWNCPIISGAMPLPVSHPQPQALTIFSDISDTISLIEKKERKKKRQTWTASGKQLGLDFNSFFLKQLEMR